MGITYVERSELTQTALSKMVPAHVLLDIGTGIMPRDYIPTNFYICCEPFTQYIDVLKKNIKELNDKREYLVLNCDWANALKIMADKSVDTVFIIDVVEHLEKAEGEKLLKDTLRVAKRQVVVFTPLGFLKQYLHPDGKDAWGLDGADWQEHKSGWMPADFDSSWEILVCKDYHVNDNLGNPYEVPAGAFWAIKNMSPAEAIVEKVIMEKRDLEQMKKESDALKERLNRINSYKVVKVARFFVNILGQVKRSMGLSNS